MALAQSMQMFVEDLKASRRSRHSFVQGNRVITKNIMAENRRFLQNLHAQNKSTAEQTHAFLKSAKETREADFKRTMEATRADLARVHQGVQAIKQGAREMMNEFREDNKLAHTYWASIATEEPVAGVPPVASKAKTASPALEAKSAAKLETKLENKEAPKKSVKVTAGAAGALPKAA